MPSHREAGVRALLHLKQHQWRTGVHQANLQRDQAQSQRQEAKRLRQEARQALAEADYVPEWGLARAQLYERLRQVAVARAHGLETGLQARQLDQDATKLEQAATQLRQTAASCQRKHEQIQRWTALKTQQHRRRQAHRQNHWLYEEIICRIR